MAQQPALLDSDTLSEVIKGRDHQVLRHARDYLLEHGFFRFSIITRYEVLRGLRAKDAARQIREFLESCRASIVYPMTEEVIDRAAEIYSELWKKGQLISDADTLIAATALLQDLAVVTGNEDHFRRIPGLRVINWRKEMTM